MWRALFGLVAIGCGGSSHEPSDSALPPRDSGALDGPVAVDALDAFSIDSPPDAPETTLLGMNDVSFLFELSSTPATTTSFLRMTDGIVPRDVYEQRIANPQTNRIANPFDQFHAVAMRFDVCDRGVLGPCVDGEPGQLRITFQPLLPTTPTTADDVALHVSYRIPPSEVGGVVVALRTIARLRGMDLTSPLEVNHLLHAGDPPTAYSDRLHALVARFATEQNIVRLTVFNRDHSRLWEVDWQFNGLEPRNGALEYFDVPGLNIAWIDQELRPEDPHGYQTSPIAENPQAIVGWIRSIDGDGFAAATPAAQMQSLEALTATQDPRVVTSKTTHCVACHTSTYLLTERSASIGVDPTTMPSRFTSTRNLSIAAGFAATDELSLRAFGYRDDRPMISQRVANETALVLDDIEARFSAGSP